MPASSVSGDGLSLSLSHVAWRERRPARRDEIEGFRREKQPEKEGFPIIDWPASAVLRSIPKPTLETLFCPTYLCSVQIFDKRNCHFLSVAMELVAPGFLSGSSCNAHVVAFLVLAHTWRQVSMLPGR